MNISCPKCSESFPVVAEALIPDSQTMHLKLTFASELCSAEVIGKAIVNMEKLQRGVAHNMGINVQVFLKDFEVKPHEVTIGFAIIQTQPLSEKRGE
jgi:hypothetical protein